MIWVSLNVVEHKIQTLAARVTLYLIKLALSGNFNRRKFAQIFTLQISANF
jgi:hypothetical protein